MRHNNQRNRRAGNPACTQTMWIGSIITVILIAAGVTVGVVVSRRSSSSSSTSTPDANQFFVTNPTGVYKYVGDTALSGYGKGTNGNAMSPDGSQFAIISDDATAINIFSRDLPNGTFTFNQTFSINSTTDSILQFSDFGNYLTLGNKLDNTLSVIQFNTTSQAYQQIFRQTSLVRVTGLSISGDSEWICVIGNGITRIVRSSQNTTIDANVMRTYSFYISMFLSFSPVYCNLDYSGTRLLLSDNPNPTTGVSYLAIYNKNLINVCTGFGANRRCSMQYRYQQVTVVSEGPAGYGYNPLLAGTGSYMLVGYDSGNDVRLSQYPNLLDIEDFNQTSLTQYSINYPGDTFTFVNDGVLTVYNNSAALTNSTNVLQTITPKIAINATYIDKQGTFMLSVLEDYLLHFEVL